ncbi:MAG: DUF3090 family protein, partial [Actinomycetota bacterium]|nr:DUF3090 family protein [Actinomycetota bacterium]
MPEVDHLTAGAVGEPGHRVFYLQAGHQGQVVSLRLEKAQVAALVAYLVGMLAELPDSAGTTPPEAEMELIEPVVAEWVVGSLGVNYDDAADRVVLVAEELVEEGEEGAHARITVTLGQVAALAARGADAVAAGRPPCPLCGQPLDPEGHTCARLNGHKTR